MIRRLIMISYILILEIKLKKHVLNKLKKNYNLLGNNTLF